MKTVAVVEDNPDNRLLVQAILEDYYQIQEYEDGKSALKGLRGSIPDIVLLDISLPEMDGRDVLKAIRKDDQLHHLPVIALTAHAMTGDREALLAIGFNDYLMKPILDEDDLINAIKNLVGE